MEVVVATTIGSCSWDWQTVYKLDQRLRVAGFHRCKYWEMISVAWITRLFHFGDLFCNIQQKEKEV